VHSQEKAGAIGASKANPVFDRTVHAHRLPVCRRDFLAGEPGKFYQSLNPSGNRVEGRRSGQGRILRKEARAQIELPLRADCVLPAGISV